MRPQTAFESFEAVLDRLEPLSAQFAADIANSGPEDARTVEGMLERIVEALGVDHALFEDIDDSRSSIVSYVWVRAHSTANEPVLKLPVPLEDVRFGVLTV